MQTYERLHDGRVAGNGPREDALDALRNLYRTMVLNHVGVVLVSDLSYDEIMALYPLVYPDDEAGRGSVNESRADLASVSRIP
jgi:hypothetical protein